NFSLLLKCSHLTRHSGAQEEHPRFGPEGGFNTPGPVIGAKDELLKRDRAFPRRVKANLRDGTRSIWVSHKGVNSFRLLLVSLLHWRAEVIVRMGAIRRRPLWKDF